MPVPMPSAVVLIVCKTVLTGPADPNAAYTGYENREWATEHSMMICRRQEVPLYDVAEAQGADAQPFNEQRCWRSGVMLGAGWDAGHRNSPWRFWRVACPVPIVRKNPDGSEEVIAWKLPDCGHRETVVCEIDTEI
ncbi:MAG: hypothetical protein ACREDO_07715 [Methyloceanibacter sp.]